MPVGKTEFRNCQEGGDDTKLAQAYDVTIRTDTLRNDTKNEDANTTGSKLQVSPTKLTK